METIQEIRVTEAGVRLDKFLASKFPDMSRSYWRGLVSRGLVQVDGRVRPADHRLSGGELVSVRPPACEWGSLPFEDWILHEDKDILVLNKPAGLLMHPLGESWLRRPEAAAADPRPNLAGLLFLKRPAIASAGTARCGLVHRLDRETSGALVVAKNRAAHEFLTRSFAEHGVGKTYRAVVLGRLETSVEVEAPVGRLTGARKIKVSPWGREAATSIKVLGKAPRASLIEARPVTGRTHQIRAHLAHIGHPVLGDPESGTSDPAALAKRGLPQPPRLLLHSYKLAFGHPRTGKAVQFTAPVPKDIKDYWKSVS